MARLQSLILTFLLKNASVMKPIFFNMCLSLEAQPLKAKLSRVETKTKPFDLCKLGINRLLVMTGDSGSRRSFLLVTSWVGFVGRRGRPGGSGNGGLGQRGAATSRHHPSIHPSSLFFAVGDVWFSPRSYRPLSIVHRCVSGDNRRSDPLLAANYSAPAEVDRKRSQLQGFEPQGPHIVRTRSCWGGSSR